MSVESLQSSPKEPVFRRLMKALFQTLAICLIPNEPIPNTIQAPPESQAAKIIDPNVDALRKLREEERRRIDIGLSREHHYDEKICCIHNKRRSIRELLIKFAEQNPKFILNNALVIEGLPYAEEIFAAAERALEGSGGENSEHVAFNKKGHDQVEIKN